MPWNRILAQPKPRRLALFYVLLGLTLLPAVAALPAGALFLSPLLPTDWLLVGSALLATSLSLVSPSRPWSRILLAVLIFSVLVGAIFWQLDLWLSKWWLLGACLGAWTLWVVIAGPVVAWAGNRVGLRRAWVAGLSLFATITLSVEWPYGGLLLVCGFGYDCL